MRSITLPRPLTRLVRVCLVPLLLVSVAAGQEPGATEPVAAEPGSIRVQATTPPQGGQVRLLLFDTPATFGRFSQPARVETFPADGRSSFEMLDVPPGTYAFVLHHDEDSNGEFDKNFIGIPRDPIAISRGYRPKGPPVFASAGFTLQPGEQRVTKLELFRVLGRNGLFGVGLGGIGRSSPYAGGDNGVFQPLPAITYNGSRLQWFGPSLRYGLIGTDELRLAATASYRLRAYEEDDSTALDGLGDRKDTLMAGLAVISELPAAVNLALGYEHDVLDRIGGGAAQLRASRSFQWGSARFSPKLGLNWTSSSLANHDFGVASKAAAPGRPAYDVDDYLSLEAGMGVAVELSRDWSLNLDLGVEFLPDEVTGSPIVEDDQVLKGFVSLSYIF